MTVTNKALDEFVGFIKERESIRIKKERGDPWPWTDDPILRAYRFCNIRREDDKETRLIHQHWLRPHRKDPDLWFAMAVARLVNWWPSLAQMGYPLPWQSKGVDFKRVMTERKAAGEKVFTGAYMVRADPHVSGDKAIYLAEMVLTPMWEDHKHIRPRKRDTLQTFHDRLMLYKDMGPFISGQIVADTKWGDNPLASASDLNTWATPGPGSLRGLARLNGLHHTHNWTKHHSWWVEFVRMRDAYWLRCAFDKSVPWLDAQNLQNVLCEYDKWYRVKLGQGRPRSGYTLPLATST